MNDITANPIIRKFVREQKDISIDRYSDKGAYGALYFGQRNIMKDRVALKFYELDPSGNGHEEAQLLKQISHENILPIFDARIIDNKVAFYLTPEMSGGDLQDVITKYIIPSDVASTICQNILKGLNELHKEPNRMVHRDLKTFNVLVDLKNGVNTYLADFGAIKKIASNSSSVTASKYTILYRTPEALNSNIHYVESDIYQVGIILYQVLGGFFPMKNPENWLKGRDKKKYDLLEDWEKKGFLVNYINNKITKGKLLDISSLPPYIDNRLKAIIRTATRVDYNRRYQSCADFLKALYDQQKGTKSWWRDNGVLHSKCLKRNYFYRIVKRKTEFVAEMSKDNQNWRKKFSGTESELIAKINKA
jgi:serine/threonine protein kinase